MPMACSQSSTVLTAEDASGLPGSSRVVLGLVGGGEEGRKEKEKEKWKMNSINLS